MNTLRTQREEARQAFLANPAQETKEEYKRLIKLEDLEKYNQKKQEFRETIENTNKAHKKFNSLETKICEVLNNYKEDYTTTNGSIRKSLLNLLPQEENISYYIRHDNLELNYRIGHKHYSTIFYKYQGVYTPTNHYISHFDKEFKKAVKYLEEWKKLEEKYESMEADPTFREFMKNNNTVNTTLNF